MMSNERIELPITYGMNSDGKYVVKNKKSTPKTNLSQYIFAEFLNGRAGYVLSTLKDFKDLLSLIQYTNISVFNMNFKDDTSSITRRISDELDSSDMVVYLVPMDYPGTYSVDSEFICSVSEILGPKNLATIKRLEYNMVTNKGMSIKWDTLPWKEYNGVPSLSFNSRRIHCFVPRESVNAPHPAFDVYGESNAFFPVEVFDIETIGAAYMSEMITTHREYIENLKPVIANMFQWVGNITALSNKITPDTRSKIQAIIVWILKSRTNRILLHVTRQDTINHLMELVAFTNVVYTGEIPKLSEKGHSYAFIDNQGMIQLSDSEITGYTVVGRCDEVIKLIYDIFKQYCILPGGVNMLDACSYPFMDNVPSIFWNGRQYND